MKQGRSTALSLWWAKYMIKVRGWGGQGGLGWRGGEEAGFLSTVCSCCTWPNRQPSSWSGALSLEQSWDPGRTNLQRPPLLSLS